jgi:hypothetical protein
MILAATKIDASQDSERIEALRRLAMEKQLAFFAVSSATGEGIDDLKYGMAERILARPELERARSG